MAPKVVVFLGVCASLWGVNGNLSKVVFFNFLIKALAHERHRELWATPASSCVGRKTSVADTGPGIPAADLPFIFDDFRQVEGEEKEGTGLGLSVAKKSMELLGGTISAESEVGQGTTFTVRINDYGGERSAMAELRVAARLAPSLAHLTQTLPQPGVDWRGG